MLYTVKHARPLVAPFVMTGGSCPDDPLVLDRLNEAQRRLLAEGRADWVSTQRHLSICARNACIALPREFEAARLVSLDGGPANLFPNSYRYLENGPGVETSREHYGKDLEDLGDGWPTFFDMPCAEGVDFYLFAASTVHADTALPIVVYGRKKDGSEILRESGTPGMDLTIRAWVGAEGNLSGYPEVSSAIPIHSISQIVLPSGRAGYVTLYAVNQVTHEMFFLSKYHPAEISPSYRRYRILGHGCSCETCVTVLAKLRHVTLTRDDDVLLIQNIDALKTMVRAIREENAGNESVAIGLEEKANSQLARQLANHRSGDPILQIQDNYGIGGSANII